MIDKKPTCIFVVVGRLGKSLTAYKTMPIKETSLFDRIIIFRESAGFPADGIRYVTLDGLKRIKNGLVKRIIRTIWEPIQIIIYSIKYRPDYINGYQLIPKGINGFIAAKVTGTKCIISSVGGIPEIETYFKNQKLWKRINLFILKHADLVTTKGKVINDYLIRHGVRSENIFIFNGSIDQNKYFPIPSEKKDIDILFAGDFSPLKGPDRIVEILLIVKRAFPKLSAVLIGGGTMHSLIVRRIEKLSLGPDIRVLPYSDHPEEYFRRAKLLLMPSISEGVASAMLEAMACGCVPIVSNVGCTKEAAENLVNSIVIDDWNDITAFADAAIALLRRPDDRASLATRGVETVHLKYSMSAQARIFKEMVLFDQGKCL